MRKFVGYQRKIRLKVTSTLVFTAQVTHRILHTTTGDGCILQVSNQLEKTHHALKDVFFCWMVVLFQILHLNFGKGKHVFQNLRINYCWILKIVAEQSYCRDKNCNNAHPRFGKLLRYLSDNLFSVRIK